MSFSDPSRVGQSAEAVSGPHCGGNNAGRCLRSGDLPKRKLIRPKPSEGWPLRPAHCGTGAARVAHLGPMAMGLLEFCIRISRASTPPPKEREEGMSLHKRKKGPWQDLARRRREGNASPLGPRCRSSSSETKQQRADAHSLAYRTSFISYISQKGSRFASCHSFATEFISIRFGKVTQLQICCDAGACTGNATHVGLLPRARPSAILLW